MYTIHHLAAFVMFLCLYIIYFVPMFNNHTIRESIVETDRFVHPQKPLVDHDALQRSTEATETYDWSSLCSLLSLLPLPYIYSQYKASLLHLHDLCTVRSCSEKWRKSLKLKSVYSFYFSYWQKNPTHWSCKQKNGLGAETHRQCREVRKYWERIIGYALFMECVDK